MKKREFANTQFILVLAQLYLFFSNTQADVETFVKQEFYFVYFTENQ